MSTVIPTVAVIGGGVSGLSVAHALRAHGARVRVYEARSSPGGAIATLDRDGYLVERGAQYATDTPELRALLEDLHLNDEIVRAGGEKAKRFVVRHGCARPLPRSISELLRTPALSFGGRLRLLLSPWRGTAPSLRGGVRTALAARWGEEAVDYLFGPALAWRWGGDLDRLSAAHVLPDVFATTDAGDGETTYAAARLALDLATGPAGAPLSFRRGLGTLTAALAHALAGSLSLSSTVTAVDRVGAQWGLTVRSPTHERQRVLVDAVVYAGPTYALADIGWPHSVRPLTSALLAIPHPPCAMVAVGVRREHVARPIREEGLFVPEGELGAASAVLCPSALFPGRAPAGHVLFACFVDGARRRALVEAPSERLRAVVIADLQRVIGLRGEPRFVHCDPWSYGSPSYQVGHGSVTQSVSALEVTHPGLYFTGNYLDGTQIADCVRQARALARRVVDEARFDQRFAAPAAGIVAGRIPFADLPPRPCPSPRSISSPLPRIPTTLN